MQNALFETRKKLARECRDKRRELLAVSFSRGEMSGEQYTDQLDMLDFYDQLDARDEAKRERRERFEARIEAIKAWFLGLRWRFR